MQSLHALKSSLLWNTTAYLGRWRARIEVSAAECRCQLRHGDHTLQVTLHQATLNNDSMNCRCTGSRSEKWMNLYRALKVVAYYCAYKLNHNRTIRLLHYVLDVLRHTDWTFAPRTFMNVYLIRIIITDVKLQCLKIAVLAGRTSQLHYNCIAIL